MLEIAHLTKRFGGLLAVNDASLTMKAGSIVALIGPNGAGKTTLFATACGFHKPDAGTVRLLGQPITGLAPDRICARGMVRTFQIVQPFGRLSVADNIAVGAHLHIAGRAAALAAARNVAAQVGLSRQLDQPAHTLTVAGRKRLELARALATQPKLLLLDEVMAGLNPAEIAEIVPVIRGIRDGGVSVLMIEHVMQAVVSLCEHAFVMANGTMIAAGTPAEIAADPRVIEAYLGHGAAARLRGGHAA
ncbi:MAG TPA: ABC transporter ATP-binding protein [Acetobacteraceae bacterium]|nr:ABC transporter ATP-binding protein [Acetobacteraceae bacterium]